MSPRGAIALFCFTDILQIKEFCPLLASLEVIPSVRKEGREKSRHPTPQGREAFGDVPSGLSEADVIFYTANFHRA